MYDYLKYLDPKILNRISRLDLKARMIVEGYIAGMHQSPYKGVSAEFVAHREYVPGDDLRYMDWKIYGRSDRLQIKQYKQETNLTCYILFDISESMDYGSGQVNKLEYARYIAASLSYLMIQQRDAVGLVFFDTEIRRLIEPRSHRSHLNTLLSQIERTKAGNKTNFRLVSDYIAERLTRKGMIIVISDLLPIKNSDKDETAEILAGLNKLRFRGHDILVFHLLDEYEIKFPFNHLTQFDGMEEYPKVMINPQSLQKDYLEAINNFIENIRRGCQASRIDYTLITTEQNLDVALSAYLVTRSRPVLLGAGQYS